MDGERLLQYFSGETSYACGVSCEASELVHFHNRIGELRIELIFKESIRVNDKDGGEYEGIVDTNGSGYCFIAITNTLETDDLLKVDNYFRGMNQIKLDSL